MSAKQLLLGHENIGAKAFLETENRLQRATRGVTLIFLRYFGILKKIPILKQAGHKTAKDTSHINRCYFLHPLPTTCMHQGFKALKSKL